MLKNQYRILMVDDDESLLFGYQNFLAKSGYSITCAVTLQDAQQCSMIDNFDAIILDMLLPDGNALDWIPEYKKTHPDVPVIVITGAGDIPAAVTAMKSGAENFLIKPVEVETLEVSLKTALELGDLRRTNRITRRLDRSNEPYFGTSPAMENLMKSISLASHTDTVVLLQGDTGTGKGVLARWIHANSDRADHAFVELNCSCLKGDLLRSELFGSAKGAFTSAVSDREGLIELADKGTLFLDEIGDMDLAAQTQLLKTIEEKTYRRIGENRIRKSEFRLICATNKDLLKETETGTFRKDLYYRICVFPLTVPTLIERSEEIPGLAAYFLAEFGYTAPISSEVLSTLTHYTWPGNIREFRNMIERAVLLAQGGLLTSDCFPGIAAKPVSLFSENDKPSALRDIERDYLSHVVNSCQGNKKKASKILGVSLATIYRKLGTVSSQGVS